MSEITGHIPLTPRTGDNSEKPLSLGYFAIPVAAQALSRNQGSEYHMSVDDTQVSEQDIEGFKRILSSLEINYTDAIGNTSERSKNMASKFVLRGIEEGRIVKEAARIKSCYNSGEGCGKCEFLDVENTLLKSEGNHGILKDDQCSICKHQVVSEVVESILWKLPTEDQDLDKILKKTSPQYARKEIIDHWKKLVNTRILLSRQRNTGLTLDSASQRYNIDQDLLNYLCLVNLQEYGDLDYFFSNKSVVRQTLLMALASRSNNQSHTLPNIVVMPRILLRSSKSDTTSTAPSYYLDDKGIDPAVLRMFLLSALASTKKEITLDASLIHNLNLRVPRLTRRQHQGLKSQMSIKDVTEGVPFQVILTNLVKKLKQSANQLDFNSLSPQEKLILSELSEKKN